MLIMYERDDLKNFYNSLTGKYQGYIQMSDGRIDNQHIFKTFNSLPLWQKLHNGINFIFEACFYDGKTSIIIRQQNDKWLVIKQKVDWDSINEEDKNIYYSVENKKEVRVVQIWKEEDDINCKDENMNVLQPVYQLFAGFEL